MTRFLRGVGTRLSRLSRQYDIYEYIILRDIIYLGVGASVQKKQQ